MMKVHEWDFIAQTDKGELGFCRLCNQFRYDKGHPFRMTQDQLNELLGRPHPDLQEG